MFIPEPPLALSVCLSPPCNAMYNRDMRALLIFIALCVWSECARAHSLGVRRQMLPAYARALQLQQCAPFVC